MATSERGAMTEESLSAALLVEVLNWPHVRQLLVDLPWAGHIPAESLKEIIGFAFTATAKEKSERLARVISQLRTAAARHNDATPQPMTGGKVMDLLFQAEQLKKLYESR